jgi:hypothetical protein
MTQRLDHEFLMRQSGAPLLEGTFHAINAETQLLYSSEWPHWDFDTPGRIADIPFLSEAGPTQHSRRDGEPDFQSRA